MFDVALPSPRRQAHQRGAERERFGGAGRALLRRGNGGGLSLRGQWPLPLPVPPAVNMFGDGVLGSDDLVGKKGEFF